jgi:hypothetical protein
MAFHTKAGVKVDAFDVDALLLHGFGGKHRIKAARNQGNGAVLSGHDGH